MNNYNNILTKIKNIHFIGIGGSGMCPMAEILYNKGYNISGSDIYESDTIQRLHENYDIKIFMNHKKENIKDAELVVYTAAVKDSNEELIAAKESNIPAIERSVMLGLLTNQYKEKIAISGTHGKTSTTSMITQILIDANLDPSAIIGGKLPSINSNSRSGSSEIIVCEACEYVDSFLELSPSISVITNVDADHLDYFGSLKNIKNSFSKFAKKTSKAIILNGDDKNTIDCIKDINIEKITFGLESHNDYYVDSIKDLDHIGSSFTLIHKSKPIATITLKVPGYHNIYNALAAASVSHYLGIDPKIIENSLSKFSGVHRRFEILGTHKGITVVDDFAHHPTELKAVLSAAMKMNFNRVWAIFQPHTYSRTYMFLDDFAKALSLADRVILSEILPVRETNTYNIYSKNLAEKIENCICLDTFEQITDFIEKNAKDGDLVLTIGGGNIYKCANMILKRLKNL